MTVSGEQFEQMAEAVFWAVSPGALGPSSWRLADERTKDEWRAVVERQLNAARIPFERAACGEGW